jgi:FkbM family methyltransferase
LVEIGAGDGITLSNTHLLEEAGWSGLAIEANPELAKRLRANRSCSVVSACVHTSDNETVDFLVARNHHLSRIADIKNTDEHESRRLIGAKSISVPAITFESALLAHGAPSTIDFLSIDIEGAELMILRSIDFSRWDIRTIAVEHNRTTARTQILDLLNRAGFRRVWADFSKVDDWFIRR